MVLQHCGLTHYPLGKAPTALGDDGALARLGERFAWLLHSPGVGLLTATALSAGQGELNRFPSGRHFASSLGLTPREFSSGNSRRLGKLTRRGDVYLRQLLIHGARSLLQSAAIRRRQGKYLDRLSAWALQLSDRVGHNKAACAVANKLARRLWAAEHHRASFDPNHVSQPPVVH